LPTVSSRVVRCRRCGAPRDLDGDVGCPRCGSGSGAPDASPPNPDDDPEVRIVASRELGKIERAILGVRTLFVVTAALHAVVAALVGFLVEDERPRTGWALCFGLVAAVALLGAILVRRQPHAWSIVLAGVTTVWMFALFLMVGTSWLWQLQLICMLGAWAAVDQTRRVKALLARFPALAVSARLRGGRRSRSRTG
jgi:hypothetical protein